MTPMPTILIALIITLIAPLPVTGSGAPLVSEAGMARVEKGSYLPLYADGRELVDVSVFEMDRFPVTRSDFLAFVTENPKWRRSQIKPIFAGQGYLANWGGDLDVGEAGQEDLRVTNV